MVKVSLVNDKKTISCKIRLDIPGVSKSNRFLFGVKDGKALAKENRLKEINKLKNIPLQGVNLERVSADLDVYTLEEDGEETSYAPIHLDVTVDMLEDLLPLITRADFSKIEITNPSDISMDKGQSERLLTKINKTYLNSFKK